jgi:hypothetical protein
MQFSSAVLLLLTAIAPAVLANPPPPNHPAVIAGLQAVAHHQTNAYHDHHAAADHAQHHHDLGGAVAHVANGRTAGKNANTINQALNQHGGSSTPHNYAGAWPAPSKRGLEFVGADGTHEWYRRAIDVYDDEMVV